MIRCAQYIVIAFIFQGCSTTAYIGIAGHLDKLDRPEIDLHSPLGIIGVKREYGNYNVYCEHISSFGDLEQGAGFNICGATKEL